ncbi:unnamed protein product [Clonostachys rosea f. rosea IK726]|uniref:t-SNARE coiled-coil homology domain-containing protein n=2 Tax=Bionectria ochroleuca TaxID=29856 RepID=A0A0B7JNA2_BIOOC|nr:unnamed protein product [Clonostachys rosea f. rosea IK726]
MNVTLEFDELLRERKAPPTRKTVSLEKIDGFLKEALRINSHITKLHQNLHTVRRAYLARAQPRKGIRHGQNPDGYPSVMSDRDREAVDKDTKEMLRELNWSIEALDGAEKIRYETETNSIQKKYGSNLGALGSWASGGIVGGKKPEHLEAESRAQEVRHHREGVIWYLRQQLQQCSNTQKVMMEARLTREVEMNRSLASQAPSLADFAQYSAGKASSGSGEAEGVHDDQATGLSAEQIQMFEEDNRDMMQYFESMHEKVQTAQRSLAEISSLQSQLIEHLATQTEHIDQLVADSSLTTENVEGGNKQLKKATQRPSAARFTFYAASGLCAFLVLWDLII